MLHWFTTQLQLIKSASFQLSKGSYRSIVSKDGEIWSLAGVATVTKRVRHWESFIACNFTLSFVRGRLCFFFFQKSPFNPRQLCVYIRDVANVFKKDFSYFVQSLCHHINKYKWVVQCAVQSADFLPLWR